MRSNKRRKLLKVLGLVQVLDLLLWLLLLLLRLRQMPGLEPVLEPMLMQASGLEYVLRLMPMPGLEQVQGLGQKHVLLGLGLLGLGEVLGQWLGQKLLSLQKPEEQDRFICQWMSKFPEDWQADLSDLRERWLKRHYSKQNIRFLTLWHLFHMILADVKIKIDNLLLFSHKIK